MRTRPDFLLEKFVHHLLADDSRPCRALLRESLASGTDPHWMMTQVLWPAAECVQQLRHDGVLLPRTFNHATRMIGLLASQLSAATAASPRAVLNNAQGRENAHGTSRCLFVASASGEPSDAGANIFTLLAEAHGFTVYFAGAHLADEEMFFALSRLEPDAMVVHGSVEASRKPTMELLRRLRQARFWPEIQIGVTGSLLGAGGCDADLEARAPMEMLELLALCPELRTPSRRTAAGTLEMTPGATIGACDQAVRDLMFRIFPPRHQAN